MTLSGETPVDEATISDLRRLQGRWRQVRFEENGAIDPPDTHSAPGAILTIDGNRFHVGVPGRETILEGSFALDARTAPKSITWTDATGEDAGKSLPAIYALSDTHFTFVAADEDMARPEDFSGVQGLTLRALVRVGP